MTTSTGGNSPATRGLGAKISRSAGARTLALFAAPALIAILVSANTITDQFVYDDHWAINELQKPAPPIWEYPLLRGGLSRATWRLDMETWGPWAPGFHITNVLLHGVASGLASGAALALSGSFGIGGLEVKNPPAVSGYPTI